MPPVISYFSPYFTLHSFITCSCFLQFWSQLGEIAAFEPSAGRADEWLPLEPLTTRQTGIHCSRHSKASGASVSLPWWPPMARELGTLASVLNWRSFDWHICRSHGWAWDGFLQQYESVSRNFENSILNHIGRKGGREKQLAPGLDLCPPPHFCRDDGISIHTACFQLPGDGWAQINKAQSQLWFPLLSHCY